MGVVGSGGFIYRENEQEQESDKSETTGLDFKVPQVAELKASLADDAAEALRYEHAEEMDELEKQGQEPRKRQRPKGGSICICGSPSCTIGGFVERSA